MIRLFLAGLIGSLASGLVAGWLRYWLGFMVIFHGLAFALLATWVFNRLRPTPTPDLLWTNRAAWRSAPVFLLLFWVGQMIGLGLAQPVFDPWQFFWQILAGSEGESFVAMTQHRTYSGGLTGLFWAFTNLLDSGLMLIFFATMMRDDEEPETSTETEAEGDDDDAEEDEAGDEEKEGTDKEKPPAGDRAGNGEEQR